MRQIWSINLAITSIDSFWEHSRKIFAFGKITGLRLSARWSNFDRLLLPAFKLNAGNIEMFRAFFRGMREVWKKKKNYMSSLGEFFILFNQFLSVRATRAAKGFRREIHLAVFTRRSSRRTTAEESSREIKSATQKRPSYGNVTYRITAKWLFVLVFARRGWATSFRVQR